MSNVNTQWRITVQADTARARSELKKFAKTAQVAGMSMEEMFTNVQGSPVARTFKGMGRELNRMNAAVQKSKVHMGQWNRYWKNSNNLIRYSKQLQMANVIAIEKTSGSMTSATAVMQRFSNVTVKATERLAYMNTFLRAASRQSINAAKNIQWAGRQITVGFGVPFGLAMTGASLAFFKFEEQLVRFRKVFNDEVNELSIEEAEERITSLANTMATQLGVARDEVMETSALFAQMGYKVEEIERLTKATTELAMLGETDAQEAGKLLRAYSASGFVDTFIAEGGSREEFEDYIKDMLNAIENNTGLSIANMVEAGMAQLVPLWSQMGVGAGIGESILAGMTEALGGRTSEAVTALKAIMQRVYDESAETTEQFSLIGIDIQSLQERYKDDFVGLIEELGNTLANNPDIQNNNKAVAETFGNLFGVRQANRAIAGLRAVSSAFDESGEAANDYGRALNSIEDRQANAARSARELEAQAESVGGQFRRLKEAILIEAAEIGETFLEMIMPLVKTIRNVIEWFGNLSETAKRMSMGFGLLVVAAGGILTTFGVLAQAVLYMGRTIGFFLPKFRSWTEENIKQRFALDHVNEALREQRSTVSSIVPLWESIEQAQRQATQATQAMTSAVNNQNQAMRNSFSLGPRGKVATSRPVWESPSSVLYSPGSESIHGGAYRGSDGRFLPAGSRMPMPTSTESMVNDVFHGPNSRLYNTDTRAVRARNRNVATLNRPASAVKWRGGAAAAGGVLGMGGMVLGGEAGSAMFGAGMGLEALSLLASPKILRGAARLSKRLLDAAEASTGIRKGLKTGMGSFMSMVSKGPVLAAIMAAVAASGYLFYKHLQNAKEKAEGVRNEFEYAAGLSEELGFDIKGSGDLFTSGTARSQEEIDEMSESMRGLVNDVDRLRGADQDYQHIFRNLARGWLRSGITEEEINTRLAELETELDISIGEIDSGNLAETLKDDMLTAIRDVEFESNRARLSGFFGGSDFERVDTARINTYAETLKSSYFNALTQGDGLGILQAAEQEFAAIAEQAGPDAALFMNELVNSIGSTFGVEDETLDQIDEYGELMSYIATEALSSEEDIANMTAAQLSSLQDIVDEYGAWNELVATNKRTNQDIANILGEITDGRQHAVVDLISELGRANVPVGELYQGLEGVNNIFQAVSQHGAEGLQTVADNARRLAGNFEDGTAEAARLKALIAVIENMIDEEFELKLQVKYSVEAADADRAMINSMRDRMKIPEVESEGGGDDAGEEDAKDYSSAFRSEMDNQRNEVVQSILDNFDKASEARMEALEDERDRRLEHFEELRDAEIEAMEEARDEQIESIEESRDAELDAIDKRKDAIDSYIDKQKELQEAMQDQIDLAVALASGERGKAAQIQNAMRFGTIEDMAKSEKERLDQQKDTIKESYDERLEREKEYRDELIETRKEVLDTELEGLKESYDMRIENEKDARDAQRDALEENLKDLDSMFLGTKQGWDSFIAEAERISGQKISAGVRDGWNSGLANVKREMHLDSLWEQMKGFINRAVRGGIREGVIVPVRELGYMSDAVRKSVVSAVGKGMSKGFEKGLSGFDVMLGDRTRSSFAGGIADGISQVDKLWYDYLDSKNTADRKFFENSSSTSSFSAYVEDNMKFHTGGRVPGQGVRDVPAVLQSGEYVIQRGAVNSLGTGFLDSLNRYHSGGFVEGMGRQLGRMMGGMAYTDPEPPPGGGGIIGTGATPTSSLVPPDVDRTWRYANWMVNMQESVIKKFATALADLPGGQTVTSAYRSPAEQAAIGGVPGSDHTKGKGVDFVSQTDNSLSNLNRMGKFFQSKPGVRWVGMPATDRTGGHDDHVHVSYYHNGGLVGKGGGKRVQVPKVRAPESSSLSMNQSGVTLHISNFHGTEENIDRLVSKVGDAMDRHHRKVNPQRSFS